MDRRLGTLGERLTELVGGAERGRGHVAVVFAARGTRWSDTPVEIDLHLRGTLRRVFAAPGMVYRLGPQHFVVLAHRHPGLALTVTTLAQQLASDPYTVGADVRISSRTLPTSTVDVDAFLEALSEAPVESPPGRAGLDTSALQGAPRVQARAADPGAMARPVRSLAAVACVAVAALVGGAGLVGGSSLGGLERRSETSAIGATSAGSPAAVQPVGGEAVGQEDALIPSDDELAAAGFERADAEDGSDDDGTVELVPVHSQGQAASAGPGETTTTAAGVGAAEEVATAAMIVVGMDLSAGLALVEADTAVTAVFVGVPDPQDVPEGLLIVALEGATPGELCALLAMHDHVVVVADTPACGGEAPGDVSVPVP